MTRDRLRPTDQVGFIRDCIQRGRLLLTQHVNMRLTSRFISRQSILGVVETLELVEACPDGKCLPGCVLLGRPGPDALHGLVAVDMAGDNVRVGTAFRPDASEWGGDVRTRRPQ